MINSCKSQEYPLNSDITQYPANSYFKDIDNKYDAFIGNWKAVYDNKTITLKISKVIKKSLMFGSKSFFQDVLIVQHLIKDNAGNIIENKIVNDLNIYDIISINYNYTANIVYLNYSGVNCRVGSGMLFFKLVSSNSFITISQ